MGNYCPWHGPIFIFGMINSEKDTSTRGPYGSHDAWETYAVKFGSTLGSPADDATDGLPPSNGAPANTIDLT